MSPPEPSPRRSRPKRRRRDAAERSERAGRRRRPREGDRSDRSPPGLAHPRRLLPIGATVLVAGLAFVGLGPSVLGAGLTLLGAAGFLYAIHRYGRLGPDDGTEPL